MRDGLVHQTGVIGVIERDGRWLVICRSEKVVAPGHWCFPGGGMKQDESPRETLKREMMEELGLKVTPVKQIWSWKPSRNLELLWWQAEIQADSPPLVPNPAEVAEARWVTPQQLRELRPALPSNLEFLDFMQKSPG